MLYKNAVTPPKILKVFLGISNTNAVILHNFINIKIKDYLYLCRCAIKLF